MAVRFTARNRLMMMAGASRYAGFQGWSDIQSEGWRGSAHDFYEISLRDQYPNALLKGARTIIDVGANIGLFSYYAGRHAPHARILAFEADPSTFAILDANLADLNVERLYQAVTSQAGTIDFFVRDKRVVVSPPSVGCANATKVAVRTQPLGGTLRARRHFLTVDVEGAEYDSLLGGKELWNLPISNSIVRLIAHRAMCAIHGMIG
jgi:FkbM family methyltransferase